MTSAISIYILFSTHNHNYYICTHPYSTSNVGRNEKITSNTWMQRNMTVIAGFDKSMYVRTYVHGN